MVAGFAGRMAVNGRRVAVQGPMFVPDYDDEQARSNPAAPYLPSVIVGGSARTRVSIDYLAGLVLAAG